MFLIERIVSLLVYAVTLVVTCYLIGRVARKQYKVILVIYLLVLAIFAFNYKPYVTADLYRLREYIQYWIHLDFLDVIKYALENSTPIWVLYSYIISKLGNLNWLQTVTCLWCFGNVFYIISHEIGRHNIGGKYRAEVLFYIMAVGAFYLQTISGIRSMLGMSIAAFCLYREVVEKKSITAHLPLWLFAALIHTSTMVLVISRCLFLLIQSQSVAKKILISAGVFVFALLSLRYLGEYIRASFTYGLGYLNAEEEYTYIWEIIIGLIETVETVYVLINYKKMITNCGYKSVECGREDLFLFTLIWSVVSVVALPFSYAVFRRYTIFCTVISIPLVAFLFGKDVDESDSKRIFRTLFGFSFLIFALSGVRGDLCGYKFFVLE